MIQNQVVQQAMVTPQESMRTDMTPNKIALFDENGDSIALGGDMVLTGYVDGTAGDVEPTDTIIEAIAKLEARIADLETAP